MCAQNKNVSTKRGGEDYNERLKNTIYSTEFPLLISNFGKRHSK